MNTIDDPLANYWGVALTYAEWTPCSAGIFCVPWVEEVPYRNCADPCALGPGWGHYAWSNITLNRATMAGLSNDMKHKVAAHEFGHSLGLWHTSCTAVMQQGTVRWTGPTGYDEHELRRLYPSARANPPAICSVTVAQF